MALASMTGFARSEGALGDTRWTWELKSVNGKGLDVRLRVPPGMDAIEQPARERISAGLQRGNCYGTLNVRRESSATTVRINETVLAAVIEAARSISERVDAAAPSIDGLLQIKGVVDIVEPSEDDESRAALNKAILASLAEAVTALVAARHGEGAALFEVLSGHLDEIERLRAAAEATPARTVDAIKARLAEQVARLLDASSTFDEARLHQEAALLATRADIREELDRLAAHVAAARTLLASGAAVGRRLDFLAQEFNREVNTLCSKSNDTALTAIGLDLKATVDQFREQLQNLE
ncbi:MAG: YicC/YloC family endoribonuclease [Hyphomicrobiales bacterium]